jgi:diguanylate cyclase (GGDEF)-like protein
MQEDLKEANTRFEAMAITDGLTQIANHRAFQDRLSNLISEQARGRGRGFALVMLDVDNFKRFNDDFGHQAGDEVLVGVARTLRENIRKIDFAARYGGEEFCVLLLDVDERRAAKLAEKLRKKVSEIENPYRQITVSVGVAPFSQKWPTEQSLIKSADDALYRAKANGKNCVVLASGKEEASAA